MPGVVDQEPAHAFPGLALQVLAKHGLATLIAGGLVLWMAVSLSAKVDQVLETVSGHRLLLQAICLNTAGTEAERNTCREAGR